MENCGGKVMKRTAFHLKLENYSDFDESECPSPKRCKTYHENYEENVQNYAEEYCDKITIIVKDVKEKREIEIHPDAFVNELRQEISKDFKIPYAQISLYFNGQILGNENTLSNSNIKDGSKVYLVKNSNKTTANCNTFSSSRENNDMVNKQNLKTVYIVSTPDIPNSSAEDFKNSAISGELSQMEEIEEEESSASFDNSTNVEGIVESMLTLGHTPSEINLALFKRMFSYMETMISKVDKLEQTTNNLLEIIEQQKADKTSNKSGSHERLELHDKTILLPPHINLPLNTEDDLNYFEQMIGCDEELASNLVKYLYQSSHGKTPCSFLLNLSRLVLSQELASGYSRFGRKGKKSFLPYKNITDIILAAASKKFDMDKDTLYEKFGRALACAPEWNGRKSRVTMMTVNELNISELTEISN